MIVRRTKYLGGGGGDGDDLVVERLLDRMGRVLVVVGIRLVVAGLVLATRAVVVDLVEWVRRALALESLVRLDTPGRSFAFVVAVAK